MGIVINDNLNLLAPKILDDRYGPYTSTTQANQAIASSYRVVGLTVGVLSGSTTFSGGRYVTSNNGTIEYWYRTGITDNDLVLKTNDPSFTYIDKEVVSGTINSVNKTFSLSYVPVSNSEHLYYNGLLLHSGSNFDYTLSGTTLTLTDPPKSGSTLICSYRINS